MPLFGAVHLSLLAAVSLLAIALAAAGRRGLVSTRALRLALGYGLAVNELIWWGFRYYHEGIHPTNLPLQLCDATLWTTVLACITLRPLLMEFTYFAGLAGSGMALLTPDLWSPWPSYPAVYFFVAHGAIVIAIALLVFGGISPLRAGALWRAFALLLAYTLAAGIFDWLFGANYMYLCRKPESWSLLDAFGPWPLYLPAGAGVALAVFWLLWLPVRPKSGARQ